MKRLLHITLTLVLAMTFVVMGSGATFHHCSCSGKTTFILTHTHQDEGNSQTTKGCMTTSTVSFSPTTQLQPTAYDFHVLQPLVAIINDWHIYSLLPQQVESISAILPNTDSFSPPPRQYLHLLRVLTI